MVCKTESYCETDISGNKYCNLQELFTLQLSQLEATLALDTKVIETCDSLRLVLSNQQRKGGQKKIMESSIQKCKENEKIVNFAEF